MSEKHPRLRREERTVEAMIHLYCRGRHGSKGELCDECSELLAYARLRLDKCPFGANKPTCQQCPVHCYQPGKREKIRQVMRYAGPRMMLRHPVLAVLHLIDTLRGRLARSPAAEDR